MSDEETYIPSARDAVIAYFGRNASGNLRCYCVRCNNEHPLTNASKVYGDLDFAEPLTNGRGSYDSWDTCDQCESCWTSLLSLSQMCQQEHDEQQARWSRTRTADSNVLIEYGVRAMVRCRVY